MKLKNLKRILSVLLTGLISLNTVSFTALADDMDNSSHFTYEVSNGIATITTFDNLITDVTLPEQITIEDVVYKSENQSLVIGKSLFRTTKNQTFSVENVVIPNGYKTLPQYIFRETATLKKVTCKYTGDDFKLNSYGFYKCTSLEELYIYANTLNEATILNTFNDVPTTATVYVKNETVKTAMETLKWPGTIVIDPSLGEDTPIVNKTALSEKITEVETFLSSINKNQYNNIEALETALASAKSVNESTTVTQDAVNNEYLKLSTALSNATKKTDKSALVAKITEVEEFLSGLTSIEEKRYVNLSLLRDALAHAKTVNQNASATQTEVDNEVKALTSARNDVQRKPDIQAGELIRYTREYEDYIKNVQEDDFTGSSWYKVKDIYNNSVKMYRQEYPYQLATQEEVDAMTEKMRNFKTLLEKADTSEQKSNLDNLIAQAGEISRDNYNQESLEALDKAVSDAQAINDGLKSEYNNAAENIKNAITNLVDKNTEPAGGLFAKVQKDGKVTNIFKAKADDKMSAAERIRITFDCASDVSYNNGATIEVKAVCGETETYKQFEGTDDTYTKGSKGWTVDLPLSSAIKSGDEISVEVFTYSWGDAIDYVYGITKVEFLDNQNILCKTITDRTILMDKLKAEIEKAEKIEQGSYSDESFAKLTKAIESAKALEEKASKTDIDKAIDALDKAVKGLKEPTPTEPVTPPTSQEPSNNSQPTKPSIAQTNKATRSCEAVAKDKKAAQKLMKQTKITKLTAKSKAKKKINVSWKKVKKAKGYEVQISAKKNFKKPIFKKFTAKTKLNIKNKKIKSKKTYYIRVRAYATYKDKNIVTRKVYSKWIKKIRKVKVK